MGTEDATVTVTVTVTVTHHGHGERRDGSRSRATVGGLRPTVHDLGSVHGANASVEGGPRSVSRVP
jgi:hypothetical protein